MALNTSGPISLGGSDAGQSIAVELNVGPTATISLDDADVRNLAGIALGTITMPTDFYGKSSFTNPQRGIFGYGSVSNLTSGRLSVTNLVSQFGTVSGDTAGVGTPRTFLAACGYGGDKGIFGYGAGPTTGTNPTAVTNKVSNTGVVSGDTAGVGSSRLNLAACSFGVDQGIFGYGSVAGGTRTAVTNKVSNTGVVSGDTAGVGTARSNLTACRYGGDKGVFAYGLVAGSAVGVNITNFVSNTGVVSGDTTSAGTARSYPASCGFGGDKGIIGYGASPLDVYLLVTNIISNVGVISSDIAAAGTGRYQLAATTFGGDRGIFGYGSSSSNPAVGKQSVTNLVSNTGVVSSNTAGIGTARTGLAACGYEV